MRVRPQVPEPDRFHDGGDDVVAPDPTAPARVVLERVPLHSGADLRRVTERFRMVRRLGYRDRELGDLLVPDRFDDFESDLVSVPGLFTWLVPRTGRHLPAALLHDGLVRRVGEPATYRSLEGRDVDRVVADRVLRSAMRDLDTGPVRSWLIWSAVTLGTIAAGSASWTTARTWRYRVAAAVSLLAIAVLGVLATLDLLDVAPAVARLPWMGEGSFGAELLGGAAAAVVVPLLLGLTWGRFAVAGAVLGVALALLLHVTVLLAALYTLYLGAEWVARRRPLALLALAALVVGASAVLTVTVLTVQ